MASIRITIETDGVTTTKPTYYLTRPSDLMDQEVGRILHALGEQSQVAIGGLVSADLADLTGKVCGTVEVIE